MKKSPDIDSRSAQASSCTKAGGRRFSGVFYGTKLGPPQAVEGNRIRLSRKAILKEQRAKMVGGELPRRLWSKVGSRFRRDRW